MPKGRKVPIVTIHGIPHELRDTDQLQWLAWEALPNAVASVEEFGVTPDKVTVFAPAELTFHRPVREIIVFIEGMFIREERTTEVRQRVADAVRDCMVEFVTHCVPDCKMIEVIPRSQNPDDGFADWRVRV